MAPCIASTPGLPHVILKPRLGLPRFSNVCRLRIIKTRTERGRPGTEAKARVHVCQSECFTYIRGRGHIKLCFIIMHCIQLAVYYYYIYMYSQLHVGHTNTYSCERLPGRKHRSPDPSSG